MLDISGHLNYFYKGFSEGKLIFTGTIVIEQEENWYVATCLENNIASQGKTIDEAMANVKEAIALYYENEAKKEELNFPRHEQIYITRLEMAI
jgi:predicted RNase H-like HicB family nuclease